MSSLKIKAIENMEAGTFLQKNELYAPTIHCFYYSCIQNIIYILLDNNCMQEGDKKQHGWYIDQVKEVCLRNKNIKRKKCHQFSTKMYALMKARKEADYGNILITGDQSFKAKKKSEEILEILKEGFTI